MDSYEDSENEIVNLSLMAKSYESDEEVSLKKSWYIYSGCSTHISPKKSGHVTYGDNNKGRILGVGKIDDVLESLEEMHIHEEDHKGKGDRNNEDFHIDELKTNVDLPREWRASRYHPLDNIIGDCRQLS